MTREQFKTSVVSQGYSEMQAERLATVLYPISAKDRRAAGLVKARAARRAKAAERRAASHEMVQELAETLSGNSAASANA